MQNYINENLTYEKKTFRKRLKHFLQPAIKFAIAAIEFYEWMDSKLFMPEDHYLFKLATYAGWLSFVVIGLGTVIICQILS